MGIEPLTFKYVGYTSHAVQVGSQTNFSIKLLPDIRSIVACSGIKYILLELACNDPS